MEHSNPARGLTALYLTFLLASCGGSSQPADCVEPPTEVFVSAEEVPLEMRELSPGIAIEGFGIRALRGCEDLDGPLAAFNWWTVRDAEGSDEYGAQVSQFLIAMGARILAFGDVQEVIEAPPGRAPDDTPWIQATLQLPLYPSARDMAGMLASREYLEIGAFKLTEQDNDDYDFVLMRCFFGCESVQSNPAFVTPDTTSLKIAHLFNASQEELAAAVPALEAELAASGLGRLYFAGYAWAQPFARLDPEIPGSDIGRGFWNDGLLLVIPAADVPITDILELDAYRAFRAITSRDAFTVVAP